MAAKSHTSAPPQAAPQINDWIGYLGLATPWAVIATVLLLAPVMLGEG